MGRKKLRKKGDIEGVIASQINEARSLFATIQLSGCNNGKCVRSAKLLAKVAAEMVEAFEERDRKRKEKDRRKDQLTA